MQKDLQCVKARGFPILALRWDAGMGGLATLLLAAGIGAMLAPPVSQARQGSAHAPGSVTDPAVPTANYVDWPTEQLIKAVPKLKGLEPATSQDALPTILKKTGENVDSFFQNLVNTTSRERIRQSASVPRGDLMEAAGSHNQDGYYVVLMVSRDGQKHFDEYRTDLKGKPVEGGGGRQGFMMTSGFAGTAIYLHSSRQPESTFRYLGRQSTAGQPCDVIAFAQRQGQALPNHFTVGNTSVPRLEQGIVWIDSANSQIVRMQTDLLAPLVQVGLMRSTTEIEYAPVHFEILNQTFWLPTEVQVAVNFRGAIYTNRHQYSDWKLFHVDTREMHDAPPPDPQKPAGK